MGPDKPQGVYEAFARWVDGALLRAPEHAAAFNFNLYEYDDAYGIQIVATDRFENDDPDWAVDPVFFLPDDYLFFIERAEGEDDWERALSEALKLVDLYLAEGKNAKVLKTSKGVGCGFVDGDQHVVWRAA